jgi:hypothetical protein
MIRVPFSSASEARQVTEVARTPLRADGTPASEEERVAMIEARLATLEVKLVSHAEELKVQISERVVRIQSRLENALRPFEGGVDENAAEGGALNVVPFATESKDQHHLHASNASEALNELNQTLRLTREHLEALSSSVDRMRQSVANR